MKRIQDPDFADPDVDECTGFSCNGLELHLPYGNQTIIMGQCQMDLPANSGQFYCFVNEESVCDKVESNAFKGMYISYEACQHPLAPKKRFFGAIANFFSNAWKTVANTVAGWFGYNPYPDHGHGRVPNNDDYGDYVATSTTEDPNPIVFERRQEGIVIDNV